MMQFNVGSPTYVRGKGYYKNIQKPRKKQPVKKIEEKYQGRAYRAIGPNEEGARGRGRDDNKSRI